MNLGRWLLSWLIAAAILTLRLTCRVRLHNDPRDELRSRGINYAYCVLHAHQVAVVINREAGTAAMVSQSADGQLLMPAFWMLGVKPLRGSSSSNKNKAHNKGGQLALRGLMAHVDTGRPAIIAVDGPRGPRSHVNKGIAVLAKQTGCAVLNVVAIPHRRWMSLKAWDRFQVPRPFTMVEGYFGEPLFYRPGESVEEFRARIQEQLTQLEADHDPLEAAEAKAATEERVARKRGRAA